MTISVIFHYEEPGAALPRTAMYTHIYVVLVSMSRTSVGCVVRWQLARGVIRKPYTLEINKINYYSIVYFVDNLKSS